MDSIADFLMNGGQSQAQLGNPKTISYRVQQFLGAKPETQPNQAQNILSARFEPEGNDYAQAAAMTLFGGGKPVSGQDISDQRVLSQLEKLSAVKKLQQNNGGATGELVDRLMYENPGMSFGQALQQVQTGYRQGYTLDDAGNAVPIPGYMDFRSGIKENEARGTSIGSGEITDEEKKVTSQGQLGTIIDDMRVSYQDLDRERGIVSTERGAGENVRSSIAGSGVGQAVGRMTGSPNQTIRDNINSKIPLLMSAIKSATGKSASEINSIPEMQLLKASVTDPKMSIQTVMKALDDLESLYGGGVQHPISPPPKYNEGQTATGPNGEKIVFRNGKWGQQ